MQAMMVRFLRLLTNRRMMAVLVTSFSSGLPLALTASVLQAWYTEQGVNLMTIGLLSFVGLPYLLKVFWAPLMERYIPLSIGKRKSWIVVCQAALVVMLVSVSYYDPVTAPEVVAVFALIIAFLSASQDIMVDAYRADIAKEEERGLAASYATVGYRLAMLLSGSLSFIVAFYVGWPATYRLMAVVMAILMVMMVWVPKVPGQSLQPISLKQAVIEPWHEFFTRPCVLWVICFLVLYKIPDAFALSLNATFLLRGLGFSSLVVGSLGKSVGLLGSILGSVCGGGLYFWLGMYRSLWYFGILQLVSNLLFVLLALVGKNALLLSVTVFLEYFCGGLSTIAFVAFLMMLCDHQYSATQYALFSAIASVSRVVVGPMAAWTVASVGWAQFYVWSMVIGLPGLLILRWLKQRGFFSS